MDELKRRRGLSAASFVIRGAGGTCNRSESSDLGFYRWLETNPGTESLNGIENQERPSAIFADALPVRRSPPGTLARPNPPDAPSPAKTKQPSPVTKRVAFGVNSGGTRWYLPDRVGATARPDSGRRRRPRAGPGGRLPATGGPGRVPVPVGHRGRRGRGVGGVVAGRPIAGDNLSRRRVSCDRLVQKPCYGRLCADAGS